VLHSVLNFWGSKPRTSQNGQDSEKRGFEMASSLKGKLPHIVRKPFKNMVGISLSSRTLGERPLLPSDSSGRCQRTLGVLVISPRKVPRLKGI
jgi:hypothetical protein